ncbi:Arogenate dehydratase/prephenate dehydratase 1 [Phytophthora cinnamomi]|uniref:Arogenate dehydratase/prephenate dehydratase 1 n=1 Tax=Phytophthora cinnamomi TaxID=4785 RepID=UPI003559AE98|nr:Arogenate dehydratase/prephenate dehydratase 1 [Phytophthora cinnamomi]
MVLATTDALEGTPASQDAKTLVPMSLSLVAKKEKILQMEAAKLEALLSQRNELLSGLQESHEHLLTTNGQLQERSRLHREKLASLRTLLGVGHAQDGPGMCDAIGANELEATAEKCGVLKDILLGLVDKRAALEQQCMALEDQTTRELGGLAGKELRLDEARSTLHLLCEDIRSAQWNLENDQAEYAGEYKRLNAVSQNALREEALIERVNAALRSENAVVEDLETIWLNYRDMAHEEHRQLAVANEDAKNEQRGLQRLLESNGATCPADEEVLHLAEDLQSTLQHLNEEVNSAKFFRREIALRRKQEKNMLTITQSSIKAKDEQLTWLERQRVHLQSEHQEVAKARAADEAAYQQYREDHKSEMNAFETQIKNAGKQVKSTERAITSRNKKVVAVNKKIAQKTKVLEEWKERIDEKKEQVAKSAATQELIDGEVLSTQEALGQELRNLEHVQRLRTAQEMEAEELCSSCTALECEAQQARKTITTLKSTIVVAQTAVKNRIDEIREKFLDTFVVSDAEILIELLNKEIESWRTKHTDEFNAAVAIEAKMLNQRYEDLAIDARNKHDKILRQKERQYNTKLKKLKAREAEKKAKSTVASSNKSHKGGEDGMEKPLRVSATGLEVEQNESPSRELADGADSNPPRLEIRSNEDIVGEAISEKLCTSKPKQKAKTVPKQAAKSARRTLVVGLNQAAVSPQANNNLADLTTNATGSTSTKTAKAAPLTSVLQHDSNVGAESDPAEDGIPSQGSLNSPVGCDEDPVASRSSSTNPVKKSVVASQGAAKKPHLQKVGQRGKDAAKRRTSTKVSHRRHAKATKVGRISLGRSQGGAVDWTAADSFSFD